MEGVTIFGAAFINPDNAKSVQFQRRIQLEALQTNRTLSKLDEYEIYMLVVASVHGGYGKVITGIAEHRLGRGRWRLQG